jgi:multiple sugar transport system permease protein
MKNSSGFLDRLSHLRRRYVFLWFLLPCFAVLASLIAFPLVYSLILSFSSWNLASRAGRVFVGLDNFREILFKDIRFWKTLRTTFVLVGSVVSVEFFLGLGLALLLHKRGRSRKVLSLFFLFPMMLAPVVIAYIWKLLYHTSYGAINYFLQVFLKRPPVDWLGNSSVALYAIIVTDIWQWTTFMFLVLLGGLMALPKEPFEAAMIDGAERGQMLRYVTLPLMKGAITVAILFRTLSAFQMFPKIWILTQGGPGIATENLPLFIYYTSFRYFDMGYGSALSYILLIIISTISLFLLRTLRESFKIK